MNNTEERARDWLIGGCGYIPEDIVFRSTKSPDFILSDGTGLEVKRVTGKTLVILEMQWLALKNCKNCLIAIFDDICTVPKALIPLEELEPPFTWGEYTVKIKPDGMAKWRLHLQILSDLSGKDLTKEQFKAEYKKERSKRGAE